MAVVCKLPCLWSNISFQPQIYILCSSASHLAARTRHSRYLKADKDRVASLLGTTLEGIICLHCQFLGEEDTLVHAFMILNSD